MRYTCRSLAQRPLLAIAAVLTIALGVGVNTAIFSVIEGVLLKPLPYREPDRLAYLWQTHPSLGNLPATYPDFVDWRAAKSFQGLGAYTFQAMNKTPLDGEPVQATMASPELFPMIGIQLVSGRAFSANDGTVGLISESLWRRKFSAAPGVVGRTIRLGTQDITVIGVVRSREAFPLWADIWLPLSLLEPELRQSRRFHPMEVVGRLKDGVTVEQAQAEMTALSANLAHQYPATGKNLGAFVFPVLNQMTSLVRPALLIVWMAVGLILLASSANVAHLLLERTLSRRHELAIRASLGASKLDLLRLLGAECLVLVACGGLLGVAAGSAVLPALKSFGAGYLPRLDDVGFDSKVAIYALAGMLLCAILVALPSFRSVLRGDLAPKLKARIGRPGSVMLASEVALAFIVLAGAILLMRSFNALRNVDAGFETHRTIAVQLTNSAPGDGWAAAQHLFENQLAPALRSLPGVVSVAAANMAPLSLDRTETSRFASRFGIQGKTYSPGGYPVTQIRWVTADYFATLGIPLLRGRLLTALDQGQPTRLINETLARRFFTGENPIGKQLLFGVDTPNVASTEIAGVVGDVRDLSLDIDPLPTVYLIDTSPSLALLIRVSGEPRSSIESVTRVVRLTAPDAAVTSAMPLEKLVDRSMARYRFALWLMGWFASLAISLVAIGVYSVIAYRTGRRTREFGIRAALGATPARLLRLVLSEGIASILGGIAAGAALFVVETRLFQSMLFQVPPTDVLALSITGAAIGAIALIAMTISAHRVCRNDPQSALRAD
jgi:putative ABC transport system permease protein